MNKIALDKIDWLDLPATRIYEILANNCEAVVTMDNCSHDYSFFETFESGYELAQLAGPKPVYYVNFYGTCFVFISEDEQAAISRVQGTLQEFSNEQA